MQFINPTSLKWRIIKKLIEWSIKYKKKNLYLLLSTKRIINFKVFISVDFIKQSYKEESNLLIINFL